VSEYEEQKSASYTKVVDNREKNQEIQHQRQPFLT